VPDIAEQQKHSTAQHGHERTNTAMLYGDLTNRIVGACYRVYDRLGFGFLESVYRNAVANELRRGGISFEREVSIDIWDMGERIGHFRADFLIEGKVILEIKASQGLCEADRKQLLNYLRGSQIELGLLMNFGEKPKLERLIYTNNRKPGLVGSK
jgi:GxxExxY protein